jgi:hypothetical protein
VHFAAQTHPIFSTGYSEVYQTFIGRIPDTGHSPKSVSRPKSNIETGKFATSNQRQSSGQSTLKRGAPARRNVAGLSGVDRSSCRPEPQGGDGGKLPA